MMKSPRKSSFAVQKHIHLFQNTLPSQHGNGKNFDLHISQFDWLPPTPLAIAAIALRGRVAPAPAPGSGDRFNGSYPTTLLNSLPDGQAIYLGAGEARRKPRMSPR